MFEFGMQNVDRPSSKPKRNEIDLDSFMTAHSKTYCNFTQ